MSILEPISSASPAGEAYKDHDEYMEIEVEIEKSFNIASENKVDWSFLVSRCESLLSEKSKDLKIASFWLYGQWQLHGPRTFLENFHLYVSLIEKYQDALFPKMPRRKIKILEWINKIFEPRILPALDRYSKENIQELLDIFVLLENALLSTVEEEFILLKPIKEKCHTLLRSIREKEEEEKRQSEWQKEEEERRGQADKVKEETQALRRSEEEEILSQFVSSSGSSYIDTEELDPLSHDEIDKVYDIHMQSIRQLLEQAPTDYLAIKTLFSLGELLLEEMLTDHTIISDDFIPSEDVCNAVRQLAENGAVTLVQLKALEEQLMIRPTWLEGYYLLSRLLYKLEKSEDAEKLEKLLLYLLHRRKKLIETYIADRQLISGKMLAWANTKLLSICDEGGNAVAYQQIFQEVLTLKHEQNTQNALALLEEHYQKASGEEARFRWRLLYVEFALEIGDKRLALALLLELERVIEQYRIDQWQPELAIMTYETLLKPIMTQELGTDGKERIYKKLSILNVQKVIDLQN